MKHEGLAEYNQAVVEIVTWGTNGLVKVTERAQQVSGKAGRQTLSVCNVVP